MDIVAPVLHDYGEYQYDGTNHWKECQDPACPNKEDSIKATTANHSFGEWTEVKAPTETQEGTKERSCVCGYKESEVIPPTGEHGETEIVGAKEATCTEEGYTGDTVCKGCGEVIEQGKVIAKLAHTYQDGKSTVCGAADPNYVHVAVSYTHLDVYKRQSVKRAMRLMSKVIPMAGIKRPIN